MQKISAVIVCKNEETSIGRCLESLHGVTDDIVVLDNGSTDNTKTIVRNSPAKLVEDDWEGYGKTKRKATNLAAHDWVLSLDADEVIDDELRSVLLQLPLSNENIVYEIKFKNFLGKKHLKYGEWGGDRHPRLFNKRVVNWDEAVVHEQLRIPGGLKKEMLEGYILHFTMKDVTEYAHKTVKYALMNAEKYAADGKSSSVLKVWISPIFTFIKYYFFKLGFLDGFEGLICARMTSHYTFLKYARLLELNRKSKEKNR